jgi:hypothetical protein
MLMLPDALQFQDDGSEEADGDGVHAVIVPTILRGVD